MMVSDEVKRSGPGPEDLSRPRGEPRKHPLPKSIMQALGEPREIDPPVFTEDLQERQVGGLGLHFMRTLMDRVVFEFDDSGNTVTMSKRIIG